MHQVCLHFFSKLFQVSRARIFRAITSSRTNPSATDRRGKYPSRKAKSKDVEYMKSFIKKMPQFETRYCKSDSSTKYLHPDLNVKRLYIQYKKNCSTDEQKLMSLSYFTKFFKRLNLKFPKRRSQNCSICSNLESKLKRSVISQAKRVSLSNQRNEHVDLATKIVNDYQNDV